MLDTVVSYRSLEASVKCECECECEMDGNEMTHEPFRGEYIRVEWHAIDMWCEFIMSFGREE